MTSSRTSSTRRIKRTSPSMRTIYQRLKVTHMYILSWSVFIHKIMKLSLKVEIPYIYWMSLVAILRSLDNMLNILIPKLSPDIPETDDIYKITDQYNSEDTINAYDGSGFSPQERALFVSMSVAAYKESVNSSLEMVM